MDSSKMTDLDNKEDGMRLIVESGYTLKDLRTYIKDSCMAEKCKFLENVSEEDTGLTELLCKDFLTILNNDELNLDEITTLFVAVSMLFYIQREPNNMEFRMHILQTTFRYSDTLHPVHLHIAAKRMWEGLKKDDLDINAVFSILNICDIISFASETGNAIATCLIWAILAEITQTDFPMYCFHEFSGLIKMLGDIDDALLQEDDKMQIVYILIKSIGFLLNTCIFGQNEELKKAGYRKYFSYRRRDLERLKEWAEKLCDMLEDVSVTKSKNFFELRMTIKEYLNFNITSTLQDKILEMQLSSPDKK